MTKVTIDDIEYDTSDFSEDQNNWVMELQYNTNVQQQLNYQLSSVKTRGEIIVNRLKGSLDKGKDSADT
tara:strand:- start:233 stop:439 length:207 start_codon:yes stop_codon:yes gene_type:complete